MKLPIGARLPHDFADIPSDEPDVVQRNRAVYRVTQLIRETPWSCLYRGKKIFRNFEFAKGTHTEAADDECLDVLIRTLSYPHTDNREYIKARREHSWFEAKQVLGSRKTNCLAEPLDYLEIRNDQDKFAFPRPGNIPQSEPVLVFETIHGDDLEKWQTTTSDPLRRLSVLAQGLDFLGTFHDAKLLLNGISPTSFWVDELDRVYFIGTETVVDERRASNWRHLFPNERYAPGFIAPELLLPAAPPTRQSDLYGWSALAWTLLTAEDPGTLAADQSQQWLRFEPAHRERLSRQLAPLSPPQIGELKRLFQIHGSRFNLLWPESFIDGLWACLDPDPAQRPASVDELRAWWSNPPPPSVPSFLAIRQTTDIVRFAFSNTGLRAGLQFRIVRKLAQPPRNRDDGEIVWEGTAGQRIEVRLPPISSTQRATSPTEDWCFSIFSIETGGPDPDQSVTLPRIFSGRSKNTSTASRPTVALFLDSTVAGFRQRFANSLNASPALLPEEIALLGEVEPIEVVAAELLNSPEPRVRGWALLLLERGSRVGPFGITSRKLLDERGLVDPENSVRHLAAGILIRKALRVEVSLIVDLAQRTGGTAVDDMIRAARGFAVFGVSKELIDQAIDSLEQAHRIVICKVCQQELRTRELDPHLIEHHNYVPVEGTLLPFGQALTRLWSRVLQQLDTSALEALTGLLQKRHAHNAISAFASALSQQVLFAFHSLQAPRPESGRQTWVSELARCLRSSPLAGSACLSLLSHDDARIRGLARLVVMNTAAIRLVSDKVTPATFRDAVDTLVPMPIVTERLEVCQRLMELGANRLAGEACAQDLELERLADCPECGSTFQKRELPRHRRTVHQIFEWDGERFDWERLVPVLLNRTVATEPDAFAARCLMELFLEKHGPTGWQPWFRGLKVELLKSKDNDLITRATGLGTAIGSLPLAPVLARAFLKDEDWRCQAAGLAIFSHLDRDPPAELSVVAAGLLERAELPLSLCQEVVVQLLRRGGANAAICRRALLALSSRADGKLGGIELLQTLERWVGPSPAIDAVCHELSSSVRMHCPRCDVVLPLTELITHVKNEHSLVLMGRSVRQPWSVAMDYLDEYTDNPQPYLLERAEQLADLASSKNGRLRLWRETLRRGIAPDHYRSGLLESVAGSTESLCPECWESIPAGETSLTKLKIDENGDIESTIVSLKQAHLHGLWKCIEITPWTEAGPGWSLSRRGACVVVALLCFIPAIFCGLLTLIGMSAAAPLASIGFSLGVIGISAVALFYRPAATEPIDAAWEYVVPVLIDDSHQPLDSLRSSFVACLARASHGRGQIRLRQPVLKRTIHRINTLVQKGIVPSHHLTEIWSLFLADVAESKHYPGQRGELLKEMLSQLLAGELSLEPDSRMGMNLERLPKEELVSGIWFLFEHARGRGMVAADLIALFRRSSILKSLGKAVGILPETIPCFFAMIEMDHAGRIPGGMVSIRQLFLSDKFASLIGKGNLMGRSKPGSSIAEQDSIQLRPGELEFRNSIFLSSPDVLVRAKTRFVQTGWTHQRTDGCADMRFSVNPPVGHDEITGYTLKVGGQAWEYTTDPTVVAGKIRAAASFLFGELEILANRLRQQPTTEWLSQILNSPGISCPRCETVIQPKPGAIAIRLLNVSKTTDQPAKHRTSTTQDRTSLQT
jgi:serine/threonine protein kinase/uncharacterized C2H2 Zn-finger protein